MSALDMYKLKDQGKSWFRPEGVRVQQDPPDRIKVCEIKYATSKYNLDVLDRWVLSQMLYHYKEVLHQKPTSALEIEIIGRTDQRGPETLNKRLGFLRAKAVFEFFQEHFPGSRFPRAKIRIKVGTTGEALASKYPSTYAFDRKTDIYVNLIKGVGLAPPAHFRLASAKLLVREVFLLHTAQVAGILLLNLRRYNLAFHFTGRSVKATKHDLPKSGKGGKPGELGAPGSGELAGDNIWATRWTNFAYDPITLWPEVDWANSDFLLGWGGLSAKMTILGGMSPATKRGHKPVGALGNEPVNVKITFPIVIGMEENRVTPLDQSKLMVLGPLSEQEALEKLKKLKRFDWF